MIDVDSIAMPWNTGPARVRLVNVPTTMRGLSFKSYSDRGRQVPQALHDWALGVCAGNFDERSVVLHGAPGSGKTGLGVAALEQLAADCVGSMFFWNMVTAPGNVAAWESGEEPQPPSPVWFERWPRLLAQHRREAWDEEAWFSKLKRVSVLMLDNIGVDTGTPYRESFLLRHLEWAEDREGRALVLTLNDSPAVWKKVLGERAADRLTESRRFAVVHVPGGSLR